MTPYRTYLARIAERTGVPLAELVERWSERAAIREYEGGMTRTQAEEAAFEEVKQEVGG